MGLRNYKYIPVLLVLCEHVSSYFSIVCKDVLYSGLGKVEKTTYEYLIRKLLDVSVIKATYALVGLYAYAHECLASTLS